ncbi:MAG TPA: ATP-binding cassette domain-containing protein [Pseudonocardia sp.]|nr:ATP-binding cassette domain-containing protein [Pseudonocardia sp.]
MLDIAGVSKRFGTRQALDDVSFTVEPGEVFGFVGSNGAGKTTTMRIVLGVLTADAGEVRWQARPVDADLRRRIGYVPAAPSCSSPAASSSQKQSRVVELLLATITPWQLLAGKVLGLGAVGLLQLVILSAIAGVGATAAGLLALPGAAVGMFVMVVVWYLLGFFLYASLYAAVGSTVSRPARHRRRGARGRARVPELRVVHRRPRRPPRGADEAPLVAAAGRGAGPGRRTAARGDSGPRGRRAVPLWAQPLRARARRPGWRPPGADVRGGVPTRSQDPRDDRQRGREQPRQHESAALPVVGHVTKGKPRTHGPRRAPPVSAGKPASRDVVA